jgi:WD40 repeat protein
MRKHVVYRNLFERKKFQLFNLNGHETSITSIDTTESRMIVSGAKDKKCKVWDLQKMKAWSLSGHINLITDVKFIDKD